MHKSAEPGCDSNAAASDPKIPILMFFNLRDVMIFLGVSGFDSFKTNETRK